MFICNVRRPKGTNRTRECVQVTKKAPEAKARASTPAARHTVAFSPGLIHPEVSAERTRRESRGVDSAALWYPLAGSRAGDYRVRHTRTLQHLLEAIANTSQGLGGRG